MSRILIENKKYIIVGILLLTILVALFFIWKRWLKTYQQQTIARVSTFVPGKPANEEIDMNTDHWKTYLLKRIGIEFKLPMQVGKELGHMQEKVVETGMSGQTYYFISDKSHEFIVEGNSRDYKSGGRSAGFGDMGGYSAKNGKYYGGQISGYQIEIAPQTNPTEIINSNGVHMLKIHGTSIDNSKYAYPPYLSKDFIGALINTHNSEYPGVAFQMKLTKTLNEEVFDKILSTFTFIQ